MSGDEVGLVFEEGAGCAGVVAGLGEGGAELGGVVVAEDEEGAQGWGERVEQPGDGGQGGFPEPGAVAEVAGHQHKMRFELREMVTPRLKTARPLIDVHIRKVQHDQPVENLRQTRTWQVEMINVRFVEHGGRQWSVVSRLFEV